MSDFIFDIETTGLNSCEDRIVCISLKNLETKNLITFIDIDEGKVISEFWNSIREKIPNLIGFNSDSFDIPFLIKRSLINRVKICKFESLDLRKLANGFSYSYDKFEKGSLNFWAKTTGMKEKAENGDMILHYFFNHEYEKIKAHVENDIEITEKLYDLIKYCEVLK